MLDLLLQHFGIESPHQMNLTNGLALVLLWPSLSLSIRRMHDMDRSGWWMLVFLLPIVGVFIMIIWNCQPGTPGVNRYGEIPISYN